MALDIKQMSPWHSCILRNVLRTLCPENVILRHTTLFNSRISSTSIVHPEGFRSNAKVAIAFARRNRLCVHRNEEFACVYLRSCAFTLSTVRDRPRARTCVRTYVHDVNYI